MNIVNSDIRMKAFKNNIKMYEIADKLNIHYVTLNNKLRKPLSFQDKQKLSNIIEEIKKEKQKK